MGYPHWTDWECGLLLLVIDWYTVAGAFTPVYKEIRATIIKWAESITPYMDPPSGRVGVHTRVSKEKAFTYIGISKKWRDIRQHSKCRGDAITALFKKVLPFKELIESTHGVSINYIKYDKLPAGPSVQTRLVKVPGWAGIVSEYLVPRWTTEDQDPLDEAFKRRKITARDILYRAAKKEVSSLLGPDGMIKSQGLDAPQWLKYFDSSKITQKREIPAVIKGPEIPSCEESESLGAIQGRENPSTGGTSQERSHPDSALDHYDFDLSFNFHDHYEKFLESQHSQTDASSNQISTTQLPFPDDSEFDFNEHYEKFLESQHLQTDASSNQIFTTQLPSSDETGPIG
jgi:hypothetical protein